MDEAQVVALTLTKGQAWWLLAALDDYRSLLESESYSMKDDEKNAIAIFRGTMRCAGSDVLTDFVTLAHTEKSLMMTPIDLITLKMLIGIAKTYYAEHSIEFDDDEKRVVLLVEDAVRHA